MKTITILISPQGDAKIEAHGFTGGECRLATQALRSALGQDSGEHLKPEYAQSAAPSALSQSAIGGRLVR
jgi:hypothetical protein